MIKKTIFSLILLTFTFSGFSQSVTTYAGTPQSAGSTDVIVNRLLAKFTDPYGLAFDSKGNLYISEKGNNTITIILKSNDNTIIRAGGKGLAGFYNASGITSRFNGPAGIAVGINDEVYVADEENHVIRKITAFTNVGSAQTISVFSGKHLIKPVQYTSYPGYADGTKDYAQFQNPTDVAVDASGNVYVADKGNNVIRKIATDGSVTTIAGQPGVAGNKDGSALVEAQFNAPTGIFVKGNDIYVADQLNSSIRKISGGQVTTVVSGLWTPTDVYLDDVGNYYICDQHRVRKGINTYAGSTDINTSGFENALGTAARFFYVKSITFNDKSLFVTDMNNQCVRKITDCGYFSASISKNGYLLTATAGVSYIWYKNGNIIFGSTAQTYTVTSTGDYSVKVTDENGCVSTSSVVHVDYVGINENEQFNVLIYPSPANEIINIKTNLPVSDEVILSIYDILGNKVFIQSFQSGIIDLKIDVSELNNGVYSLDIFNKTFRKQKQIVISR